MRSRLPSGSVSSISRAHGSVCTVTPNFVASSNSLTGAGSDAFSSIEALKLSGGLGDNVLDAARFISGPVTLDGGAGDDRLIGGLNSDVLIGGVGDDALNGNRGDDTLLGGEGDDALDGGPGTDVGDGGPGNDTFKGIEVRPGLE
jgi:Ca2+-binding RTX toxin-like protein